MNRLRAKPTFNLFAIAFGLAGLAGAIEALPEVAAPSAIVSGAVWVAALLVWSWLLVSYLVHTRLDRTVLADLRHPVLGPFVALVPVVGLMLVAHFSRYVDRAIALAVASLLLAASMAFAAWFTARLLAGGGELAKVHPGYLLPTVAGTLVSALCFSNLEEPEVAYSLTGIGLMFWVVVTGLAVTRGLATPDELGPLTPTLAIHAAPAPVAGLLWLSLGAPGGQAVGAVLFGLTIFGLGVQAFLVPRYLRLTFAAPFWSFTFSSAAVASFIARWVGHENLPAALAVLPVAAVALLIVAIAVRHILEPLLKRDGTATSSARPRSERAASRVPQ